MSFRFRYPMEEKGYLLELYKSGILNTKLSALSKYYLSLFLNFGNLTSYEIFSFMRDTNNRIAKNNVQKKIKVLKKQGFLNQVKAVEKPIHRRIFYKLSSFGLFYIFANIPEILYARPFHTKNTIIHRYASDPLLELLFRNILDKNSIRKISSIEVGSLFISYLEQRCQEYRETIPLLMIVENNRELPLEICCWEYVSSNTEDGKSLAKYLIDKLQLKEPTNSFQIERYTKDKILISLGRNSILIKLDGHMKRAQVYHKEKLIYELDVMKTSHPSRNWLLDKISSGSAKFLSSSHSPLTVAHTEYVPTIHERRLIVNILATTLVDTNKEHVRDLKLLKKDGKFMKLYEDVQKEITVSIQEFNQI